MSYGQRIKEIRERKGIKSCFVAGKLGLTPAGYSGIERGRTRLKLEMARKIADILGVDIKEFFFEPKLSETRSDKERTA